MLKSDGFDETKPALIGYPLDGKIQLLLETCIKMVRLYQGIQYQKTI
jgi:hypothetical protein